MSTLAESLVAICRWIGELRSSPACGMQIVSDGSALPGLQVCAADFRLTASIKKSGRRTNERRDMKGPSKQYLCCREHGCQKLGAGFQRRGGFYKGSRPRRRSNYLRRRKLGVGDAALDL